MSWARIDDQIAFHDKVVGAGNEAFGAWVRMVAWSCAQLSDGRVPAHIAATIAPSKVTDRLVAARLLHAVEGGFEIHDFHDWNPRASEVKAKREAERERKAKGRKSQGRGSDGRATSESCPPGHPRGHAPDVRQDDHTDSVRLSAGPTPTPTPTPVLSSSGEDSARAEPPAAPTPKPARVLSPTAQNILELLRASEDLAEDQPPPDLARSARQLDAHGTMTWGAARVLEAVREGIAALASARTADATRERKGGIVLVEQVAKQCMPPHGLENRRARFEPKASPASTHDRRSFDQIRRDERKAAQIASLPDPDEIGTDPTEAA